MTSRRFAFVVPPPFPLRWSPPAGEDFLMEPARLLAEEGHQVEVLTTRSVDESVAERMSAISVRRFATRGGLIRHIAGTRYDVVHAHGDYLPSLLTGLIARGARTMLTRHSYVLPTSVLKRKLIVKLMNRFERVNTVSPYETQVYESAGVTPSRLVTLSYAINVSFFSEGGDATRFRSIFHVANTSPVILFVANLRPVKNPLTIFRALSLVKQSESEVKLVVVGKDLMANDPASSARALAKQCGVIGSVLFVDWLTAESLRDALAAADVVVNSSLNEGLALAISEAAAARKPICLPAIGSFQSVYGKGALYHEPRDHETLAKNILNYMRDKTLRDAHVAANWNVVQQFEMTLVRRKILELYHQLLAEDA